MKNYDLKIFVFFLFWKLVENLESMGNFHKKKQMGVTDPKIPGTFHKKILWRLPTVGDSKTFLHKHNSTIPHSKTKHIFTFSLSLVNLLIHYSKLIISLQP